MKRKFLVHFFIVCNIGIFLNFVQADIDFESLATLNDNSNLDCNCLGSISETLKTRNEELKSDLHSMIQPLINRKNMWDNLDKKLDNIDAKLENIENNILKETNDHLNKLIDLTKQQYETIITNLPAADGDEQWEYLINLTKSLKIHDVVFDAFRGKLIKIENVLNKGNGESRTFGSKLTNIEKILNKSNDEYQNFGRKLKIIENVVNKSNAEQVTFGGKLENIQNIVHKGKEESQTLAAKLTNIENVLNKSYKENQTRQLNNSITKNFQFLQNIEQTLRGIEKIAATKDDQIAIKQNVQNFIDKTELTKTCFEKETKLVCTPDTYPTDCEDYKPMFCSYTNCRIYNNVFGANPFLVSCDNKSAGGGWTVIQRRMDGSVDFQRDWSEYKAGFGDINGEFFIGLDKLHALTTSLKPVELLIQAETFSGRSVLVKYDVFEVGSEIENYKLKKVGNSPGYDGRCLEFYEGENFSTKDHVTDNSNKTAERGGGGWWYGSYYVCNLNGKYYETDDYSSEDDSLSWYLYDDERLEDNSTWFGLKSTQMSIRKKFNFSL